MNHHYSEAHFFGPTKSVGKYQTVFQTFPINPASGENTTLGFSLLGNDGNNVLNVAISAEIKEGANTIYTFSEKRYEFSDVSLDYTFPREGIYKIIYHANVAGDDTPVIVDFDIFVGNSSTDANWLIISIGIVLAITGIIFWLKRRKLKDQTIREDIT
jgi:hypothetical protein